jgi:hypothetical protein
VLSLGGAAVVKVERVGDEAAAIAATELPSGTLCLPPACLLHQDRVNSSATVVGTASKAVVAAVVDSSRRLSGSRQHERSA